MRWFITAMALVLSATAAAACINDREVQSHEREFKSQYLKPRPPEQPSPEPSNVPLMAAGGGLILLTAAAVIAGRSA
jgi:hypothetical protein